MPVCNYRPNFCAYRPSLIFTIHLLSFRYQPMAFTQLIRHCRSKFRQLLSDKHSYLLEAFIVLLIMLLLVLGIGWM